ncbi:hypothetical protein AAHH79_42380, partial [Burkholderia pseudomallei]
YMVVGAPGAGKSAAIASSGLKFPLADQMEASSERARGGTANCEWWFAYEAVLIDTAGRYVRLEVPGDEEATVANGAE